METYAYCLLDNHVHWLVKCESTKNLQKHLKKIESLKIHQNNFLNNEISYAEELEFQLKDFFITYSLAYNKMHKRNGSLFINPFRRLLIKDESHFTNIIIYILANILKHKIAKDFQNYKWSSYQSILSSLPTLLKRDELLEWLGGKDNFIKAHLENSIYYFNNDFSIEI